MLVFTKKNLSHFTFFVFIFISLELLTAVRGNDDTQISFPLEVSEKLTSNALGVDPISIVWVQQKTSSKNKEALLDKMKISNDVGFLEQHLCIFMWQDGKAYFIDNHYNSIFSSDAKDRNLDKKDNVNIQERAYNGDTYFAGTGHKENEFNTPRLGLFPNSYLKDNPDIPAIYQQYTTFWGYKFPNRGGELGEGQQSYITYLINHGKLLEAKDDTLDGKPAFCVSIEAHHYWDNRKRLFSFWLDPEYNYAVKQIKIKTLQNKIAYFVENMDFIPIPKNPIYIPKKTVVQHHTNVTIPDTISETPLVTEIYTLSEVSTKKIDNRQFSLNDKYSSPGTRIGDRALQNSDGGISYAIPANPADLDRVIEAALTGEDFTPTPIPSRYAVFFRWILVFAGVGLVGYVLFTKFVMRRE